MRCWKPPIDAVWIFGSRLAVKRVMSAGGDRPWAGRRAPSMAVSIRSIAGRRDSWRCKPSEVSVTRRLARSNSGAPIRSSRDRITWLTRDGLR